MENNAEKNEDNLIKYLKDRISYGGGINNLVYNFSSCICCNGFL